MGKDTFIYLGEFPYLYSQELESIELKLPGLMPLSIDVLRESQARVLFQAIRLLATSLPRYLATSSKFASSATWS